MVINGGGDGDCWMISQNCIITDSVFNTLVIMCVFNGVAMIVFTKLGRIAVFKNAQS